jgi:glycosyltransferase involved in cell wall biosynthesis
MRLIIASHVPLAPSSDGAWLAFHGVAEVAEGLAARGWRTTVLGRAVAMEPASRAVEGGVSVVAVAPRAGVWRDWWEAARAAAGADAALIFMPSLACALLAAIMGPRAIVYAGGAWGLRDDFPRRRALLERVVARRARALVVSGHGLLEYFRPLASRVELTVPLVTSEVRERFQGPPPARVRDEPLRVLFVGWINAKKGVRELLDAVADVPEATCRIVGPADDEAMAELVRTRAAEGGRLQYAGYVDWPELGEHYSWANVLALPSHSEGFPRVAFEATAYGLALVLTPVGGIPARLRSEHEALLVPASDREALRGALERLRDAELRGRLAHSAHAALAGAFTEPDAAAKFDRILREIVAARGRRVSMQ